MPSSSRCSNFLRRLLFLAGKKTNARRLSCNETVSLALTFAVSPSLLHRQQQHKRQKDRARANKLLGSSVPGLLSVPGETGPPQSLVQRSRHGTGRSWTGFPSIDPPNLAKSHKPHSTYCSLSLAYTQSHPAFELLVSRNQAPFLFSNSVPVQINGIKLDFDLVSQLHGCQHQLL